MSSALEDELCILLQHGAKIPAVKRYREATGVSLTEAKRAVDGLIESGILAAGSTSSRRAVQRLETEVLEVLSYDGKLAAVKLYCDRTSVPLKEAKAAVDDIAARHHVAKKRVDENDRRRA